MLSIGALARGLGVTALVMSISLGQYVTGTSGRTPLVPEKSCGRGLAAAGDCRRSERFRRVLRPLRPERVPKPGQAQPDRYRRDALVLVRQERNQDGGGGPA